jgi:hypothetical protein
VTFILREYEANGDYTDSWGDPGVSPLATPGWVGDSGPIFAVGPNTVSADLMLLAEPTVYGQPASAQITQPVLALTGFTSRDGNRSAVFSPEQLIMQGRDVSVYISSVDGLATLQTSDMATSQDQGIQLNRNAKMAWLWSGASAVVQMLMDKARIAFGSLSWLELTSTLADLRGPSVRIGDGTNNVTITGNAMSGADLTIGNTFPSTLATTATAQALTNKNLRSNTNAMPYRAGAGSFVPSGAAVAGGVTTITIPHGLGSTPTWAFCTVVNTGSFLTSISALTATTATFNIFHRDGAGAPPTASTAVQWLVGFTI